MRILIVDDEKNMVEALKIMLENDGYMINSFTSTEKALKFFKEVSSDLIITDLKMPIMDGIEFTKHIKEIDDSIPVIIMTAYGTVKTAVNAMKLGAFDYIIKPFEPDELKIIIHKALSFKKLLIENKELKIKNEKQYVGSSIQTEKLIEITNQVADTKTTVLVRGESGTGKELIANLIHNLSSRKEGPFIKVNCAAIPENLLESELFGHVKGSFTGAIKDKTGKFQMAQGGTLFLDEIGDLSPALQSKLLRVLQEKQYEKVGGTTTITADVRIVAATHKNLEEAIEKEEFREDLFYRLNVFPITITPLRERLEEIEELTDHFIKKFSYEIGKEITNVDNSFVKALKNYTWPGNTRELSNFIERTIILSKTGKLSKSDVNLKQFSKKSSSPKKSLEELEKNHILSILNENNGNKAKTAEILGIDRSTLYRMMKRYELD